MRAEVIIMADSTEAVITVDLTVAATAEDIIDFRFCKQNEQQITKDMIPRALKAIGVVLGIPLLVALLGVGMVAIFVMASYGFGLIALRLMFGPWGGC